MLILFLLVGAALGGWGARLLGAGVGVGLVLLVCLVAVLVSDAMDNDDEPWSLRGAMSRGGTRWALHALMRAAIIFVATWVYKRF